MGHRTARVGKVIQQEVTRLLQRGALKDPRIRDFTTITGVEVTGDLSLAKVFFTVMGDEPEALESTRKGLEAAAGFLHRHLARVLNTRVVPTLTFVHDASIAYGDRIDRLLAGLPELEKPAADDEGEASEAATDGEADEGPGDDGRGG